MGRSGALPKAHSNKLDSLHVAVACAIVFGMIVLASMLGLPTHSNQTVHIQDDKGPKEEAKPQRQIINKTDSPKVAVHAYIETLCPDSADFVVYDLDEKHFPPELWNIVDFTFVPWGKVTVTDDIAHCQHGSIECKLNKVVNCAINRPLPPLALPKNPPRSFNLLTCMFSALVVKKTSSFDMPAEAKECAKLVGLPYTELELCAEGPRGQELANAAREATESLSPRLSWVPWVVVNGEVINAEELADAANVARRVCAAYNGTKPEACTALMAS